MVDLFKYDHRNHLIIIIRGGEVHESGIERFNV